MKINIVIELDDNNSNVGGLMKSLKQITNEVYSYAKGYWDVKLKSSSIDIKDTNQFCYPLDGTKIGHVTIDI